MKANADKCHLLLSSNCDTHVQIDSIEIKNSRTERLLGIKFDNKLSFEQHVTSLCKKASQKLHALARVIH